MPVPSYLEEACQIVHQLQEWIEDREWLSEIPQANLAYSVHTLQISIGDVVVYCDQVGGEMTLEECKREFLKYVDGLRPFVTEALPRVNI